MRTNPVSWLWRRLENLAFLLAFVWLCEQWFGGFGEYLWSSVRNQGLLSEVRESLSRQRYDTLALIFINLCVSIFTLWEITRTAVESWRRAPICSAGAGRWPLAFTALARSFKHTFMSAAFGAILPRLIVLDLFWLLQPHLQQLALIHVSLSWYGWLYALLVWDLATWVYHYSTHRVRLLWCLHSPHHAPVDMTITTAWVHFFAETYYTTTVQLLTLSILGVPAVMLAVFLAFEVTWGTLIHTGERVLRTGRLGILRFLIVTPSMHRVHHARNPLYMDTNFCTLLPFIDWALGTLQPLRDEVPPEYGITRNPDMTSFIDTYFGEFPALWKDLRSTPTLRLKLHYLLKPPGWTPEGSQHTAAAQRRAFLRTHPHLAVRWQPIKPH